MKDITHIFFDLDHTLWDYKTNSSETLIEIYDKFGLGTYFHTSSDFINSFHYYNDQLWAKYDIGQIDREYIRFNRFHFILNEKGNSSKDLALSLSDFFTTECPKRTALLPGSRKVLVELSKRYKLGIITNGFNDIQGFKLNNSGIQNYFDWVITSESYGIRKPAKAIFDKALEISGASLHRVLMVGDNLKTDILGANAAGWKSVWYNPNKLVEKNHEMQVENLEELLLML